MGLSASDTATISAWLHHTLIHGHSRIDEGSVLAFKNSLRGFRASTGLDLSATDNRVAMNFLRFCITWAWNGQHWSTQKDDVVGQFRKLGDAELQQARQQIELSLPPEASRAWKTKVDAAIEVLRRRINDRVAGLNNDFLFPAFKDAFKNGMREAETKGVDAMIDQSPIPKYGPVDQLMQTPDEAFAARLKAFSDSFDTAYLFAVSVQQIEVMIDLSRDWQDYNGAMRIQTGTPWPILPVLNAPATQPAPAPK
jgi:hypothetical protein